MKKNFFIKTLGCKTNQTESQIITEGLISNGFSKTNDIKSAHFYILNSCAVTSHAESQANYLLNQAKRKNPNIKTVIVGCYPQTSSEINADILLGNYEKLNIASHLEKTCVDDIFSYAQFDFHLLNSTTHTRPSIKIQDGCNNRCAYCIIPFARGRSRSNKIENIIKQIDVFVSQGIKEIVLTGIHIGQWGLEWRMTLLDLVREIEKTDIERYRLGSLYVNELSDELIDFLHNSNKFCPHFHISLQSFCDKTLLNMRRNYTTTDVFEVLEKINFKNAFIGCDVIVGFPNETDEDFDVTYKNLKNSNISKIHVFPYSKRKGTLAYNMECQIQESVKTQRVQSLTELSNNLYSKFINKNLDLTHEFLFEKKNTKLNLNCGISKNYIKAYFNLDGDLRCQTRKLKLSDAIKIVEL